MSVVTSTKTNRTASLTVHDRRLDQFTEDCGEASGCSVGQSTCSSSHGHWVRFLATTDFSYAYAEDKRCRVEGKGHVEGRIMEGQVERKGGEGTRLQNVTG